jgi:hypothetical protein
VCDIDASFAKFGEACAPCWPRVQSLALISMLAVGVVGGMCFFALRKNDAAKSEASIALKITLSYVQVRGRGRGEEEMCWLRAHHGPVGVVAPQVFAHILP